MAVSPKLKKITGSCTQIAVVSFLILQNWKKLNCNQNILVQKLRVNTLKLQLKMWGHFARPIKAHLIDQSLNEAIVMSYYLIRPINQHQLTGLISIHNYNDRARLANQKPNTNYIISKQNVCNTEIAKLPVKNYAFLNVNILHSTQFMNLRLWESNCYSPSPRTGQVFSKSEYWPKFWLEGFQEQSTYVHYVRHFQST